MTAQRSEKLKQNSSETALMIDTSIYTGYFSSVFAPYIECAAIYLVYACIMRPTRMWNAASNEQQAAAEMCVCKISKKIFFVGQMLPCGLCEQAAKTLNVYMAKWKHWKQ